MNWVLDVDADIRGFYDNLSYEWTMKFIEQRLASTILRLLKAGVSADGRWSESNVHPGRNVEVVGEDVECDMRDDLCDLTVREPRFAHHDKLGFADLPFVSSTCFAITLVIIVAQSVFSNRIAANTLLRPNRDARGVATLPLTIPVLRRAQSSP